MFVITLGPGNVDLSIPSTMVLAATVSIKTMDGDPAMIPVGLALTIAVGLSWWASPTSRSSACCASRPSSPRCRRASSSSRSPSSGIEGCASSHPRSWVTSRAPTCWACRSSPCSSSGSRSSCTSCSTAPDLRAIGHGHRPEPARGATVRGPGGAGALHGLRVRAALFASLAGFLLASFSGGAALNMGDAVPADLDRGRRHRRHLGGRWRRQRAGPLGRGALPVPARRDAQHLRHRRGRAPGA